MPRRYRISIKKNKYKKSDQRDWTSPEYKTFRKSVMKRDKRKCQFPDCRKQAKQVHHIIPWHSSVHLRYDENNGISLCKECHDKIKNKESYFIPIFASIIKKKNEDNNR